ncbi:4Fe-4S dicluster domain-containing protein [Erythrobacter sp. KY5]|uniref:4Fe-4S dicluster domain-containing protein n=1 Tax=Erythrobacter sp. KY5 TaxID=2011159 RepID=UPI0013A6DF4B|nr:4Fe-4S dicluster domain-containing protein [Erythrobacter sp. KY5]
MGIIIGRETQDGFEPSWLVKKLWPKTSGNTINGLGEREDRPATPVFHRLHKHPFLPINLLFLSKSTWDLKVLNSVRRSGKIKEGEKEKVQQALPRPTSSDKDELTRMIQTHAEEDADCDLIRVAANHKNLYFDMDLEKISHIPKYAIVLGLHQDYEEISKNLEPETWWKKRPWNTKWRHTSDEVMSVYERTHASAARLADKIREAGYHAEAIGGAMGSAINVLRTAIESGMGELGKHGSILNDRYGPNLRFSVVLTDMPLHVDGPREVGADEFCYNCKLCTTTCPPSAISDRKQLVRGATRWYVNFDKCMPFFIDTKGCALCIAACPWSRPGVAPNLSKKMLARMERKRLAKMN